MTQDEVLEWFFEHYADPAECLPYESKEGGYIPIYGPLEETRDILYHQFPKLNDEQVEEYAEIIELGEYGYGNDLWTPLPSPEWYGDGFDEVVISGSKNILDETTEAFERLRMLLKLKMILLDEKQTISSFAMEIVQDDFGLVEHFAKANSSIYEQDMLHLFFVKAFSIMESFLEDFIINYAKENISDILEHINDFPKLRDQQIKVGDLIGGIDGEANEYIDRIGIEIEKRMWAYYQSIIWHQCDLAKKEYSRFGFNIDLSRYDGARNVRHDLIHRDGKRKEKMEERHEISRLEIENLIIEGLTLVGSIREQIDLKTKLRE